MLQFLLQLSDYSEPLHRCVNAEGKTCFHLAALSGETELVDVLLQAGVRLMLWLIHILVCRVNCFYVLLGLLTVCVV